MGEIRISKKLEEKLFELILILYEKEYFGFVEEAENYVLKIYDFIEKIDNKKAYFCKNPKYGKFYSKLIVNKNTTIYIVFDKWEDKYLINNIFNNHEIGYTKYCD